MNKYFKDFASSKFILAVLFILIFFFIVNCKSLFPSMLTIEDKDFKANVHSVLLLPVYIDNELIPSSLMDFNADYRKSFFELINNNNGLICSIVYDLLINGKYKLKVSKIDNNNLSTLIQKKTYSMVGNNCKIIFNDNKRYSLSPETVNNLLNQYNVDAILFHYLQVNKLYHFYDLGNAYLHLPELCLQYKALLYVKDGKNIYDDYRQILEVSKNVKNCEKYEPILDVFEEGAGSIIQLEEKVYDGKNTYYAKQIQFENLELNKMDDKNISIFFHKKISMYLKDLHLND